METESIHDCDFFLDLLPGRRAAGLSIQQTHNLLLRLHRFEQLGVELEGAVLAQPF